MSGEARLTKKIKDLEGKLVELAALSNNTIVDGSFTGEGILKAASLLDICQQIYKEMVPTEEAAAPGKEEKEAKAEKESTSEAEVVEAKASNE
jgi:hypothetical protein